MRRRNLYVFNAAAAIAVLVFEAHVREVDVPVGAWQLPLARPPLDLLSGSVGTTCRVAPAPIGLLEEALIVTLQLLLEDDATHLSASRTEAVGRLLISAIQPCVVRQLARLRDTHVVRLIGFAFTGSAALLEDLSTAIRERHQRRPRPTHDVRRGADQTLATEVCEVAILHAGIAVLLA
jgi:hypothetical protein